MTTEKQNSKSLLIRGRRATQVLRGITFTDFQRRLEDALAGDNHLPDAKAAIDQYVKPLAMEAEVSQHTPRAAALLESHFQEMREAVRCASLQLAEADASQLLGAIDEAIARCSAVRKSAP